MIRRALASLPTMNDSEASVYTPEVPRKSSLELGTSLVTFPILPLHWKPSVRNFPQFWAGCSGLCLSSDPCLSLSPLSYFLHLSLVSTRRNSLMNDLHMKLAQTLFQGKLTQDILLTGDGQSLSIALCCYDSASFSDLLMSFLLLIKYLSSRVYFSLPWRQP